jgi:hypothetical protein
LPKFERSEQRQRIERPDIGALALRADLPPPGGPATPARRRFLLAI